MSDDFRSEPKGSGPLVANSLNHQSSLRQILFERIRAAGTIARVDAARGLDISPATVTALTGDLIEMGLVREYSTRRDTGRGRPRVSIGIVPEARHVIGLKLSDKQHTAVLTDLAGNVLASVAKDRQTPLPETDALYLLIEEMIEEVCAAAKMKRAEISAVGVGVPGFVEHEEGRIQWSPLIRDRNVEVAQTASLRLGLPVTIDNDANLATLAELWFGSGREERDFAVVTIEHGVGMGMVINHRLYRGSNGLGMELGHTKVQMQGALCRCGQRGCLEAYLADYALAREAATALGPKRQYAANHHEMVADLYAEAVNGDQGALSIFRRAGQYLALGLANVSNLFDPGRIILSGVRMQYDLLYADNVLREVEQMVVSRGKPPPPIEVRAWGDLIWARGAAALALDLVCNDVLGDKKEVAAE